jgi:hypothetical protein
MVTSLFISSCGEDFFSTTLDVEAPLPEEILVTHAFLNIDDNQLALWVSGTENILNNSFEQKQLEGAQVTLSDDKNNVFSLDLSDTNIFEYEVNSIDSQASEISITTEAPNFENNATALQQVPSKTVLKSLEFFEDGGLDTEGDERSAIEIVFDDPPGVENFYEVFISINNSTDPNFEDLRSTYTNSNDPIVTKGHDYYAVIFDDSTFDGQTKNLNLSLYPISESNAKDRIFITWRNISKDYFRFTKTYKAFDEQEDNPFATPVQIFSNFENGHGIFSAYREQLVPVF